MAENYFSGVVVRATGSWYEVLSAGERYQCRIRGKLRLKGVRSTNPVVVGDEVQCLTDEQGSHVIIDITPRRNYVIRRASNLSKESHIIAANIDQALLLVTLRQPETALEFVDRFLVTCEAYKIPVVILLAKIDLQDEEEVDFFRSVYEPIGYRVVEVSAVTGEGVEEVHDLLVGRTTLLSGNSGVGKSSILNALEPDFTIEVGEVSNALGRGRHTTRHVELFHLNSCGAEVIDTPGFSSFEAEELNLELKQRLAETFIDFAPYREECRFVGCSHTKEKGCEVLSAVKAGHIQRSRHQSYLRLHEELKSVKEWEQREKGKN